MPRRCAYGSDTTASVCSAVMTGRDPRSEGDCMVSLPTERSLEQRDQSDHADVRSADAVEATNATAWYQEASAPGLTGRWPLPSIQSEHPQDDDDHDDRADDVQD